MSRRWRGKLTGVRTLRALSVRDALKRLKWMTRVSGARVMVIFFTASRSFLHRGQRHSSSPARRSGAQYEFRQWRRSHSPSRGISTLILQKASYVVLVTPHVWHVSCEACWPANRPPMTDMSRCWYRRHSIIAEYWRGNLSRCSSSWSESGLSGGLFQVRFKSSCM